MTAHRRRWFAAAALLSALGGAGCADVPAWERGVLARPQMALDPHPMRSSLRTHAQASRESAPAPGAAEGGGCGCY